MEIRENLTNVNFNPRGTDPKWIVIHNTANGTSAEGTAEDNTKYFKDVNRNASAHYFVDDGDTVWQCVRDTDTAWHVGDGESRNGCHNYNAIGIEVCETAVGLFTEREIGILQELVPMLMEEYGIDADHVCRHHDVTGKDCPWYYTDDGRWAELKARILEGNEREIPMECIICPDGSKTLFHICNGKAVHLDNPDQVTALRDVYREATGEDIPYIVYGSPDAPWGWRYFQSIGQEAVYWAHINDNGAGREIPEEFK